MVFFSGLERGLIGTGFNSRVDECRALTYALKAYTGMQYNGLEDNHLRSIPYEVFMEYKEKLPPVWVKRGMHYYTEQERVTKGAELWRKGDIEGYGALSFESGQSSIYNWEAGSEELIAISEIMTGIKGIYGGRFAGGGFRGSSIAIIDPAYEESIERSMAEAYIKRFPKLEGKYSIHFCNSADGIGK